MFIRVLVLFFIILSPLYSFHVKDGTIGVYLNKYPHDYDFSQYLRVNFEIIPYEKIRLRFSLGNKMEHFKTIENIKVVAWKINASYYFKYNLYTGIGDKYLNLTPYGLHCEEWNDNIFKGLFVHFDSKRYRINVDGFIGLHSQETNRMKFDGAYLKTDAGYLNQYFINRIDTGMPSIWGAFKLAKEWNDLFNTDLIYIRENYSVEKKNKNFSSYYYFYNDIVQVISTLDFNDKIVLKCRPAIMNKKYTKYNGAGDYYGKDKHKLVKDYVYSEINPAGDITFELNELSSFFLFKGNYKIIFQYIDHDFNPVHMDDGRLEENRGENFLDNLITGEKGYIINLEYPLIKNNYAGYEYRDFQHTLKGKKYYEQRYYFKQYFTDRINLTLMLNKKDGYLDDHEDIDDLNGIILIGEAEILSYLNLKLWIVEHKDNIRNNNNLFFETKVRF